MPIVTNLTEVFRKHLNTTVNKLKSDQIMRAGATNLLALVSMRIQNEGKATNGRAIEADYAANRSQTKRRGAYSSGHFYHRRTRGRQTDKMDLTLTGKTLDIDFTIMPVPKGWGIGFTNSESLQRIRYLEEMFRTDIIKPSEEELALAFKNILEDINHVIKADNKRA